MIKIPATKECIPAIQSVLEKGINVNVTLIFSVPVYREVANAYISALEARAARGEKIDRIASVASFFVSRVDAIVEKSFEELAKAGRVDSASRSVFFGKVGVANSKAAYGAFEEVFGSDRFRALREKGARVQRPLWASTGTKNPAFKAVMYVEALAGRDTVNTMPPATVKALLEGASISGQLHQGHAEAASVLESVNAMGISTEKLLVDLQVAGVKSFSDSYQELLDSIEAKRKIV
jgi:transaldolase